MVRGIFGRIFGRRGAMNQNTVLLLGMFGMVLLTVVAMMYMNNVQMKQLSLMQQQQRTYDGKINATFVQNIPDIGAVTAGSISADGTTVTLSYMPTDIVYGRTDRMVYYAITIDGYIKDLDIHGDKVSTALDLTVVQDKTGVVYADPEQYADALKGIATTTVDSNGEFDIHIPIDTYDTPVDKIYIGTDFRLLENPSVSTLTSTKIYDIRIEAERADADFKEVHLSVNAQYNVTA